MANLAYSASGNLVYSPDGNLVFAVANCCVYQLYTCPTPGTASGKYVSSADWAPGDFIDVSGTVHHIPVGAVAVPKCPGMDVVTGTAATEEDCEGGEADAPCSCPEGLAESYLIDFDVYEDDVFVEHRQYLVTADEEDPCTWSGSDADGDISLGLNTTPPCKWVIGYVSNEPGGTATTSRTTGLTPLGNYPDSDPDEPIEIRNVVITPAGP